MASLPAPKGGDQDRGRSLMAMLWTEVPVAIIVVAMRMYSRFKIKATGLDDWTMVITLILFVLFAITVTIVVHFGGARHLYYLTPANIERVVRIDWAMQPYTIMSLATGKMSVAFLILRLLGPLSFWRKWFLYINIVLAFVFSSLAAIFTFAQCNPPRVLWEGPTKLPHAKCWNPSIQLAFSIFSGSYNAFLDFCLALLPITVIWNLNLKLQRKIAVCTFLSLGIFASVCAAVKTSKLPELAARADWIWTGYDLFIWASTENFLLIICGSVPTLKPLYDIIHEHAKSILSSISMRKSTKPHRSDKMPERSYAMNLDPSFAARSYRVDVRDQSPPMFTKRYVCPVTKYDSRNNSDGHTLLEMGDISVESGWEVTSEQRGWGHVPFPHALGRPAHLRSTI